MNRRLAAFAAASLLAAAPVAAATPAPAQPVHPAGTVVVVILLSDGMTLSPFATGVVPPTACLP